MKKPSHLAQSFLKMLAVPAFQVALIVPLAGAGESVASQPANKK
jgi:hypothetical protein